MNADEYIWQLVKEISILFTEKGRELVRNHLVDGLILHFLAVHEFHLNPENIGSIQIDFNVERYSVNDHKGALDHIMICQIYNMKSMQDIHLSEHGKLVKYANDFGKARELVEATGIDVTAYNNQALKTAVEKGNFGVVNYLLFKGADIQAVNGKSFNVAVTDHSVEFIKKLHEFGAKIDDEAFHYAAIHAHLDKCQYLAENGANPQPFLDFAKENIGVLGEKEKKGMWWAEDWIKTQNVIKHAEKLDSELSKKPSKADRLVSSIDHSAEAPVTHTRSTRQKI
ncbi:hypothetical protein [Burkholderia contaminans]|uniref:hypothetical protein n=1 Tax=Burkholderia contaminans TaxID=488447 RepID=UPI00158C0A2B|nr:hypothetical protein [Burkholderia contaminans]